MNRCEFDLRNKAMIEVINTSARISFFRHVALQQMIGLDDDGWMHSWFYTVLSLDVRCIL